MACEEITDVGGGKIEPAMVDRLAALNKRLVDLERENFRLRRMVEEGRDGPGRSHIFKQPLCESERNFRAIFDNAIDGVLIADTSTQRFCEANEVMCRMLGYSLDELYGLRLSDIHPPASLPYVQEQFNKQLSRDITLAVEIPVLCKSGEIFYADVNASPVSLDGRMCLMGVFRDITERRNSETALKKAEVSLARYRRRMARAETLASLGTLSATLVHELAQPLTVLKFSIQNLVDQYAAGLCGDSASDQLRDCAQAVDVVMGIIKRFRNFAMSTSPRTVARLRFGVIASRVINLLAPSARSAGMTVSIGDLYCLPPLYFNQSDIEQVFFAIIQNAIQAAEPGRSSKLVISGVMIEGNVVVKFWDNCCGIAADNIEKIFDPFFTTKPAGFGSGLGLCIVKQILGRHGGDVTVESLPGSGSTFCVVLPANLKRDR